MTLRSQPMCARRAVTSPALILLVLTLGPGAARGDGGAVRLSRQAGPYRVTVFTAPTPLRAGPADVSVFVQDGAGGEVLPDVTVRITLTPVGHGGEALEAPATHEAATNKLFQAATFDLPAPGRWRIAVTVEGPPGPAECTCEVEAEAAPPRWVELWPWFAWPAVPVVLFVLHQVRARKGRQGNDGRGRPPGWGHNPSRWSHRLPVLLLALAGCGLATYLTLYQVDVLPSVWEPFFGNGSTVILRQSAACSLLGCAAAAPEVWATGSRCPAGRTPAGFRNCKSACSSWSSRSRGRRKSRGRRTSNDGTAWHGLTGPGTKGGRLTRWQ